MEFKSIEIENFRNFEHIKVTLANRNLFFGMNDVGKTNFLYALRYVFDKEVRKEMFLDSDYYKKETTKPIKITVEIDISSNDEDSQKIRAKARGAMTSDTDIIFIQLIASYDSNELVGNPVLSWGNDPANLKEMNFHGIFCDIDYVFKVIYIDAYVDTLQLFRKNVSKLVKNNNEEDKEIVKDINNDMDQLNSHISSLSGIKMFEETITPEYKKYRSEDVSISIKSEIAIKGLYRNIIPHIKNEKEDLLYPTSGEGRKKLLAYSIYDLLAKEQDKKYINLFLVEEPENHLHKSLQKILSNILFTDIKYKYLFMTTHSSSVLTDMNDVNLVRIFNEKRIDSKSYFYTVPPEYAELKRTFNCNISEAIFADRVLLVEGPSELVLFDKVLSSLNINYEAMGSYVLAVNGIRFKDYFQILNGLGIKCAIKTDNDLRRKNNGYSLLGFHRVNGLIGNDMLKTETVNNDSIEERRNVYDNNMEVLNTIRKNNHVFLSRCGLEEDLDEIMHDRLVEYLPECEDNPITYLQKAKQRNMAELVLHLTNEDCKLIYSHYNFECLKELI